LTHFVLVHGGLHTSWCWRSLYQRLSEAGHLADAVDMPGRPGGPRTSHLDLDAYATVISAAIEGAQEPVVLVLHSIAGLAGSLAAATHAQLIVRVVLVNALLPEEGQSGMQLLTRPECLLTARPGALVPSLDGSTVFVESHDVAIEAFYNRCEPSAAVEAAAHLVPEPLNVLVEPMPPIGAAIKQIPKTYIGSRHDRLVPWALQRRVSDNCAAQFVELDGDHSPWLSAPDDVLAILDAI
jgi:pimeloyl-ACP methyl ester carboxylesterase